MTGSHALDLVSELATRLASNTALLQQAVVIDDLPGASQLLALRVGLWQQLARLSEQAPAACKAELLQLTAQYLPIEQALAEHLRQQQHEIAATLARLQQRSKVGHAYRQFAHR